LLGGGNGAAAGGICAAGEHKHDTYPRLAKRHTMTKYFVTWEIDIDAVSPRAAAKEAMDCMQDPDTTALVFKVFDQETGEVAVVDLCDAAE